MSKNAREKTTESQQSVETNSFWNASEHALFDETVISLILRKARKTLQCDRWRSTGIPYRKIGGRVLYQKCDVVAWIESHKLICSTSQEEVSNHAA